MAGLGERFTAWIDERATEWKGRLAGWLIDSTVQGTEAIASTIEPQILELVQSQLDMVRNVKDLDPAVKKFLDGISVPKNPAVAGGLIGFLLAYVLNLANGVSKQALEPVMQQIAKLTPFHTPGLSEVLDIKLRRGMDKDEYEDLVGRTGWSKEWADRFMDLKHPTLPSDLALSASLRDPVKFQWAVDNLPRLGLTEKDIELLTEMQWRVPGVQDIIRYVVREAYDEATVAEFGQDADYPTAAEPDAAKTGIRPEQLKLEWRSHWDLPGISQGYDMLHRTTASPTTFSGAPAGADSRGSYYNVIDREHLEMLLKAKDVMPAWRDKLIAISYNPYARVDARRMWDFGVLDDEALKRSYLDMGYDAEHADNLVTWTKVYTRLPSIVARYKNGWIDEAEARGELADLGVAGGVAERLWQSKIKSESAARTAAQKNLTLAQIEKGVKKGKISRPEAITLLVDLGYDLEEATFLLDVDVPLDSTDAVAGNRELTKSDILAGLKANTITLEEARTRLIDLRYLPADADYILRVYTASIKPPADPVERDISKADITAAVKLGLVTPTQGYELLRRIGFSDEAATFILSLVPESSPFSPLNFDEFKALTGSWRRSQGLDAEVLPPAAQELRLQQAQAVAEGRQPVLETLRLNIDSIRRQRRKGALTREQEIAELTKLGVPSDYLTALVANDDARMARPTPAP